MSESDDPDYRDELLRHAQREMYQARKQYYQDMDDLGRITDSTRKQLVEAAMSYRDQLRKFSDDEIIKDDWQEADIDRLEDLLHEQIPVEQESPGRTSNNLQTMRPAVLAVDHRRLLKITHRLDDFAKRLGFAPHANSSVQRTDLPDEMLEELEKWRQNNL